MEKWSVIVVSLLENINDTHKKGIEFEKKSMDNKVYSIKEFHQSGKYLSELKIECKSSGINFIETLKDKTEISEKSSQRYRLLYSDTRLSTLIENENGDKLKGIKNLGLMKLLEMSKLSDKDFETVVGGDDTPLDKKKVTPPPTDENESDVDTPDTDDEKDKDTPDTDDESNDIPEEYLKTLGDDYLSLIKSDKGFLVSRISEEIVEKQKLEKEIVELKKQLDNLSPQGEV